LIPPKAKTRNGPVTSSMSRLSNLNQNDKKSNGSTKNLKVDESLVVMTRDSVLMNQTRSTFQGLK